MTPITELLKVVRREFAWLHELGFSESHATVLRASADLTFTRDGEGSVWVSVDNTRSALKVSLAPPGVGLEEALTVNSLRIVRGEARLSTYLPADDAAATALIAEHAAALRPVLEAELSSNWEAYGRARSVAAAGYTGYNRAMRLVSQKLEGDG